MIGIKINDEVSIEFDITYKWVTINTRIKNASGNSTRTETTELTINEIETILTKINEHKNNNTETAEALRICPKCGLNPNETQPEQQQKTESEHVKKYGICNACQNEQNF